MPTNSADGERCDACGKPPTATDPLRLASDGNRVHRSHFEDPASGYYSERPILGGP